MIASSDPLSRRWLPCGVMVALTCALSACALIQHDRKPYSTISVEQIRVADDIHLERDGWPAKQWWSVYGDPQLNSLIARALASAPTIVVARTRVAQAKSDIDLVRAGTNLQLTAIAAVDRERVSSNGFLGAYSTGQPAIGATGPWYTEGIVGLGGSLDVDIWGKQRAEVAASIGVHNARLAEVAAIELELSADVAQLYYGIRRGCARRSCRTRPRTDYADRARSRANAGNEASNRCGTRQHHAISRIVARAARRRTGRPCRHQGCTVAVAAGRVANYAVI
ncbi:outer membrane efflux protein [Trinickia symbiotica]|nr:outer membrane efflux protein [Trinickia symbiotica]